MKFNTTTILGLAYVMMLMGAHVLAIREKVSFERTSHRHRTIRKGRKGRKGQSKTKVECPAEASSFNYFNFFKALTLTAIGSTTGDVVRELSEVMNPNLEKECGIKMNELLKSEVTKRIKTIETIRDASKEKIEELTTKVNYVNKEDTEKFKQAKSSKNPREVCVAMMEILQNNHKYYEELKRHADAKMTYIDRVLTEEWTLEDFKYKALHWYSKTTDFEDRKHLAELVDIDSIKTKDELYSKLNEVYNFMEDKKKNTENLCLKVHL